MGYSLNPFRERVYEAEQKGATRKEIADGCHMAYQTLLNIMSGRDQMKTTTALKCCEFFKCGLDQIMEADNE